MPGRQTINIMKNLFSIIVFVTVIGVASAQSIYETDTTYVHFFSDAPLEKIEAKNTKSRSLLNVSKKEMGMVVPNIEFEFESPLMGEHFNENYMETHKYKTSSFKGKINEDVDLTKEGTYEVTTTGKLNIHGVEQDRTIKGTVTVKGDRIIIDTKFQVKLEDHKIKVPKIVVKNLAEVVDLTIHLEYIPKKPKQ
ncbi:MAG: hypothetical protein COA57_08880 [Flavobacteriales bacterium]|nr:MAG: hypothetical protein COA57_08880 [Flavobacteriales bacterium]